MPGKIRTCLFAILAAIPLGCGPDMDEEPGIVLAAIYNLNGDQSSLGGPSSYGLRLAIEQANKAGGVNGMPVNLVMADGNTDPNLILQRSESLFEAYPTVSAAMGLSDTDMVLAAAPVMAKHGVPFVTSGATSPQLPGQVPDWLFLAAFGDNVQAAAAATYARDTLNKGKAIILYNEEMTYTTWLQRYFGAAFSARGGEVTRLVPYNPRTMNAAITRLAEEGTGDADLIYLAVGPQDVVRMIVLLRRAGINTALIGGDAMDIGEGWEQIHAKDVWFTTHVWLGADAPDPRVNAFRLSYQAVYPDNEPDAFAALGFDTANLVMEAIRQAGSTDPTAIRDALANMQDFDGLTGRISYTDGQRVPTKPVTIIGIDGGKQSLAATITPTEVPEP